MKNTQLLAEEIRKKKSLLCVGLDPDYSKIPFKYKNSEQPLFHFCKDIIEWTHDYAIAFKLNIAFFESQGPSGWEQLQLVIQTIPPECLVILDAKRADIGNTSSQYAEYYYNTLKVDAVTLHPYMGLDSIEPFMSYDHKWAIILALTSNAGSKDLEMLSLKTGERLFERVLQLYGNAYSNEKMMFVCGATQPEYFQVIRKICPDHFLLVPGVGAQGGDLEKTILAGKNKIGGLLINVSRDILFGPASHDPYSHSKERARYYQSKMSSLL